MKGYSGEFARTYIDATVPDMAFGEYWVREEEIRKRWERKNERKKLTLFNLDTFKNKQKTSFPLYRTRAATPTASWTTTRTRIASGTKDGRK